MPSEEVFPPGPQISADQCQHLIQPRETERSPEKITRLPRHLYEIQPESNTELCKKPKEMQQRADGCDGVSQCAGLRDVLHGLIVLSPLRRSFPVFSHAFPHVPFSWLLIFLLIRRGSF